MENQNQNQKPSLENRVMNNMASKIGSLEGNLSLMQEQYTILKEEYDELQAKYNELLKKSEGKK